jgi:hypothetical protein
MIVYTVHEPSRHAKSLEERADNIVFVKEGFSWLGFLVAPLWLLINRLWFELGAALIFAGVLGAALTFLGFGEQAPGLANLLVALIVGFEGNDLKRWRLERKGYVFLASVAGRDFEDCERRFFDAWLPYIAGLSGAPKATALKAPPPSDGGWRGPSVIGTLPGAIA